MGGVVGEWGKIHAVIPTACGLGGWSRQTGGLWWAGRFWVETCEWAWRKAMWGPVWNEVGALDTRQPLCWCSPHYLMESLPQQFRETGPHGSFLGRNPQLREVKQNAWATELISSIAHIWTQVCVTVNPLKSCSGKQGLMGNSKTFCNLRQVNEASGRLSSRCQNWFCL